MPQTKCPTCDNTPLWVLEPSPRIYNALINGGILTLEDLSRRLLSGRETLLEITGIGGALADEIVDRMEKFREDKQCHV